MLKISIHDLWKLQFMIYKISIQDTWKYQFMKNFG